MTSFFQDAQNEKLDEYDHKVQAPLLEEADDINQDWMYPQIQLTSFDWRNQNLEHPTNPVQLLIYFF